MSAMRENEDNKNTGSFKKGSITRGLRAIMLCMVVLVAVSFFASAHFLVRREQRQTAGREAEAALNSLSESIYSDINRYREFSRLLMLDQGLRDYLWADAEDIDLGFTNTTRYSILSVLNVTTMVDSVIVFRNDGIFVNSSRDQYIIDHDRMDDPEWTREILEQMGGTVISINCNQAFTKAKGRPYVSVGRAVYDISTQEKLGILFLNISSIFLDRDITLLGSDDLMVMGEDGTVLAGNAALSDVLQGRDLSNTEITHLRKNGREGRFLYSYRRIDNTPLLVVRRTQIGSGFMMVETIWVILCLLLVYVIFAVVAGAYITGRVTGPVLQLASSMRKNKEKGRLDEITEEMPANEIGVLKDSYNGMVERINILHEKNLENEQIIRKAEMRVLHEQIKPHFLYNSLETIGSMAMESGAEDVHTALETLGSFYRNFLSKGDREIPLEREINIVKDYLSLQKLRYGDIIEDEYDIAPEALDCMIPKLILQPIVENSIYHGIRMKGERGLIVITARLEEWAELHIYIRDTGIGMEPEKIESVLDAVTNPETAEQVDHGGSFGLWGTIERIRRYCGTDDVVRIRSEVGEYTEIEFILPVKHKGFRG
ncbi:MAG: sensor histidine kinase [Lachnospiraceae bacterium]|nr:sensor histidine kinase [Lachnospiraceae bacterium]